MIILAYFPSNFSTSSKRQVSKEAKKKYPKPGFFFFFLQLNFKILPSKQADCAQTADNKMHSGNNYHPLRLNSHICMKLVGRYRAEEKKAVQWVSEREREAIGDLLLWLFGPGEPDLQFSAHSTVGGNSPNQLITRTYSFKWIYDLASPKCQMS